MNSAKNRAVVKGFSSSRKSRRRAAMVVSACALASLCANRESLAASTTFSTTASDFLVPGNWNNGLPGPADEAVITQSTGITISYTGGNLTVGALNLQVVPASSSFFKTIANVAADTTVSTLTLNGVPGKPTINVNALNISANSALTIQGVNPTTLNTGTLVLMLANDADFRITEMVNNTQLVISADIGETSPGKGITFNGYGSVQSGNGGTLVLSGNNTFTGPFNLRGGSMSLLYGIRNTSKIGNVMNIGGATLSITGNASNATVQNLTNLNLTGGHALVLSTSNANFATLGVGAINRAPGSILQFKTINTNGGVAGITTSTPNGPQGFLGGWAVTSTAGTQNPTDWAMNDGSGNVVQFGNYVTQNNPALWNANENISSDPSGFSGTLTTQTIGSLRVIGAAAVVPGASTINIDGRLTISSGGYLGASTGGTVTFNGGEITSGTTELMMTMLRPVTINSAIVDNGAGSVGITKTGTPGTNGDLTIPGAHSFSGDIHIDLGQLNAGVIANSGVPSSLGTSGTVYIGHGSDIGSLSINTIPGGSSISTNRSFVMGDSYGCIRNVPLVGSTGVATLIFDANSSITGGGFTRFGISGWTSILGSKTFSGLTTVGAGTLDVNVIGNIGQASGLGTGTYDPRVVLGNGANGGTLNYSGTTDASTDRPFVVVGTSGTAPNGIRVENGGTPVTLTLTGGIVGTSQLMKAGSGTLVINTANLYSGPLTIARGALSTNNVANIGQASGLGTGATTGAATITIGSSNQGTLSYTGNSGTTNRPLAINPQNGAGQFGGIESTTGTLTLTGGIDTNGRALAFDGGGTIAVNSAIVGVGSITKNGGGTLLLNGTNAYTGTTTVNNGVVISSLGVRGAGIIANAGTLAIAAGRDATNKVSTAGTLSIAAGATVDLDANDLVYNYNNAGAGDPARLTSVQQAISTAFANGAWTGTGLTSSAAKNDATKKTALGFAEASAVGITGTFDGQNVDGDTIVVRYTYYGDANLDGAVTPSDFTLLGQNFSTGTTWAAGDFNYDGKVNALDFNALATTFGSTPIAPGVALGSLVPEPIAPATLVMVGLIAARRRRSR